MDTILNLDKDVTVASSGSHMKTRDTACHQNCDCEKDLTWLHLADFV